MDKSQARNVLEVLLFMANRPLTLTELADVIGEDPAEVEPLIAEMKSETETRGSALQISEIAEGYQLSTREGYGYWVKKLFRDQTTFRLSPSALETLSIIAYKQPITRAEIEEIRGVEVTGVLETLIERKLAKVAGRKEAVGRPLLYATTPEFLRHFHLWRISELPSLEDLSREAEQRKMAEGESGAEPGEGGITLQEIVVEEGGGNSSSSIETPSPEGTGDSDKPSSH